VYFEIVGPIFDVEVVARGSGVRSRNRLRRRHGPGAWRKMKGKARVRLYDGSEALAEVHWYEAHGIGKKDFKIKAIVG
jgi:hypothetical protein